jgi:hypothetical protein
MKIPEMSLLTRQKKYGTEKACLKMLFKVHWPDRFMAAQAVDAINKQTIREFLKHRIKPGQTVRTDAFPSLNSTWESHKHDKKITPSEEAPNGLPLVHIMIDNLKKFLNGTFHGVLHKYLQEPILSLK